MILHIPHSSDFIPDEIRETFLLSDPELESELLVMTDAYTDTLYSEDNESVSRIVHLVSRLVVDPERFPDDSQEMMAEVGMGAVYMRTSSGEPLRNQISEVQRKELMDEYYYPHHASFEQAVDSELRETGTALIIDCHSFPSKPLAYESDQNPSRPDICVGTDEFHTPDSLRDIALHSIRDAGFSVEVNRPFSGSIVPMKYYRKNRSVRSIMIELNRRLYMDESNGRKNDRYEATRLSLISILKRMRKA